MNKNVINYSNIVDEMSKQEEILKRVYEREKNNIEFTDFKAQNSKRLEPKALYRVLREINERDMEYYYRDMKIDIE